MRVVAALTGALLLVSGTLAPAVAEIQRWSVIRDRSSIALSVRALGLTHTGGFGTWTSSDIRFDPQAPESAEATIEVRAASLTMRQPAMTRRAVGPDFLDVEHYPSIRFRLRSVEARGARYTARADVTLKGRTRPVSFPVEIARSGEVDRMTGGFVLDRVAYGVGSGGGLDGLIARDVRVDVSLLLRQVGS